jgi:hypothetical protein
MRLAKRWPELADQIRDGVAHLGVRRALTMLAQPFPNGSDDAQDLGPGGSDEGQGCDDPAGDITGDAVSQQGRMVQLLLDTRSREEFRQMVADLRRSFETRNNSETVLAAVRLAHFLHTSPR